MPSFKKCLSILSILLAGSIPLLLPAQGNCSGTLPLNRGTITTITDIDETATGGPPSSFLNLKNSGAAECDRSGKMMRAMAKASSNSRVTYWTRMETRFSIQKGNDGSARGKARITLYGLSFSGSVNTPRDAFGQALLKMTVISAKNKTRTELNLLNASGNGETANIYQKQKTAGSVEVQVAADDTLTVELELAVSAGTGFQDLPAEVDFYSQGKKVTFEGVRIEILETEALLPIATPLPEQVFFYDNARCLHRTTSSCLILNKGDQVHDLTQRPVTQDTPETWNDRIACLKIGANVNRVTVYQHPHFKGKSRTYIRTTSNPKGVWCLQGSGWDRNVSSILVE